jgi:hypothetical protein
MAESVVHEGEIERRSDKGSGSGLSIELPEEVVVESVEPLMQEKSMERGPADPLKWMRSKCKSSDHIK